MKQLLLLLALLTSLSAISPQRVIVLYNLNSSESKALADYYAIKRQIPANNLIGLDVPAIRSLPVEQYQTQVVQFLSKEFSRRKLWTLNREGVYDRKQFDLIVSIYGVPYMVGGTPMPPFKNDKGELITNKKRNFVQDDASSFDSELALIGTRAYPKPGAVKNHFYKSPLDYTTTPFPGMILTGRLDGPNIAIIRQLIDDAIATEKTGLYGSCYLDYAFKGGGYKMGDDWLGRIAEANEQVGILNVIEKTKDVYFSNYPFERAALYYGWYRHHFCGPFTNPNVKLLPGSIAVHIHSFSAKDIRHPKKQWVGPILAKGAAVTLGNVKEPFLGNTTHLDLFHQYLLKGLTVAEASWRATPVLSWHNLVIGDPLYRPFQVIAPSHPDDAILLSVAPHDKPRNFSKLIQEAEKRQSPLLYEAAGLACLSQKSPQECLALFQKAIDLSTTPEQRVLNLLHQISYLRSAQQEDQALKLIVQHLPAYEGTPLAHPLMSIKNIIAPPPPPPVTPD